MRIQQAVMAIAIASIAAASFAVTATSTPSLLTAEQKEVQTLAASLRDDPAIKAARDAALRKLEKSKAGTLADGKATLGAAVDELVNGVVLFAADNDPGNPKVIWNEALPYQSGTVNAPGARYGGDNPDRVYRSAGVNPKYRYEIKVTRNAAHPSLDYSFEAIPLPSLWGQATAALQAKDIDVAKDGTFTITADASPANGRRNHLQLPPGSATILFRDTLSDWQTQLPNNVTIRRIDNAQVPARSRDAIVKDAVAQIDSTVNETIKFLDTKVWNKQTNTLTPIERTLSWGVPGGVVAVDRFSIKDDEALVITLDPITAKYLSIHVTDPWLRSAAYSKRTTSLSNQQAKANADGSFTYVLSRRDPGVHNWLDSGDLRDGLVLVRWELFAKKAEVAKAVREVRKVKLSELASVVPADHPRVAPEQRKQLLAARESAYQRRLGTN